jgi:predicted NBD/HSP70 family sugar kinase
MISGKPKSLKSNNRRLFLHVLRNSDELSVAEISEKINLSKTTVMKIIDHYLREGFLIQVGKGESTNEGGKKPVLYKFNRLKGFVFAVQVFPKLVSAVLTDLSANIIADLSHPIRENETLDVVIDTIAESFTTLLHRAQVEKSSIIGIVIGNHGITDYNRGLSIYSPHFSSWDLHADIKGNIQHRLGGNIPLFIDNQIRFQVFAERLSELGKDKQNLIVVEAGEGLVAGIIVKDQIKRGVHGLAGEIGHMVLNPFEEEQCVCGGYGCFEVMVSINRLLKRARKGYDEHRDSLMYRTVDRDHLTAEHIFEAANTGDQWARELMDEVIYWFSLGFSNLILTYDPEIIILHGIYTRAGDYFLDKLRKRTNEVSLTRLDKHVEIEYSSFGREQGVIGGAFYAITSYFEDQSIYE